MNRTWPNSTTLQMNHLAAGFVWCTEAHFWARPRFPPDDSWGRSWQSVSEPAWQRMCTLCRCSQPLCHLMSKHECRIKKFRRKQCEEWGLKQRECYNADTLHMLSLKVMSATEITNRHFFEWFVQCFAGVDHNVTVLNVHKAVWVTFLNPNMSHLFVQEAKGGSKPSRKALMQQ